MYYLVYTSAAKRKFSDKELEELLTVARDNNVRDGITGMLLYGKGIFMQALEGGSKEQVAQVYEKISADPRHNFVMKLKEGEQDKAQFSNWSMGFQKLDSKMISKVGFSQFMDKDDSSLNSEQLGSDAWKLLKSFRENYKK